MPILVGRIETSAMSSEVSIKETPRRVQIETYLAIKTMGGDSAIESVKGRGTGETKTEAEVCKSSNGEQRRPR